MLLATRKREARLARSAEQHAWPYRAGFVRELACKGIALVAVCAVIGCTTQSTPRSQMASQQIALMDDAAELESQIRDFVEFFQATVEHAAVELERKAGTQEDRRAAILFRVRLIAQCRAAADQPDPKEALLDLWAFSCRTLDYLSTGAGNSAFAERQSVALDAAKAIHTAAEALAERCITHQSFEHARQTVQEYAAKHPMQNDFSKPPVRNLSDEPQGEALQQLIGLPFAPLTALAGVGRTPDSIRSVSKSVDRFTDVAEDFPANARWQLQLLAMNLGESPQVAQTVTSMERFSESSSTLAANSTEFVRVAEEMPDRIAAQAHSLLDRLDASQPDLRTTLGEASRVIDSVSTASDRVAGSAAGIADTVDHVRDASASLEKAADAVTATAKEVLKFIPASMKDETGQLIGHPAAAPVVTDAATGADVTFRPAVLRGQESAGSAAAVGVDSAGATGGEDKSFSFQAVGRSAEALGETADKLRDLLADVRSLLDGGSLSREVGAIDGRWRDVTDVTGLKLQGVIDHAAKRVAQLILLLFGLLIGYRWLLRRFGSRSLPAI